MKRKLDHKTHIISVKYAEERRSDNESMIGFAMDPKNQHLLCRSSFRVKTGLAGQTDRQNKNAPREVLNALRAAALASHEILLHAPSAAEVLIESGNG